MKDADFIYPDTTERPALLHEDVVYRQTPQDICGKYAELVKRHYEAQRLCETDEQRDKALKRAGISSDDRKLVAGLLKGLRDHGYYILDTDRNGRIVLGIATDSFPQKRKYSEEEIKKAKLTFKTMANDTIRGFGSMPTVTEAEIEDERHRF